MESFCSECKKPDILCKGMCQACYSKIYRNKYKKKVQKAKAYKRPYFLYKENELVDVCFSKKEINGNYDFITRDINKIPSVIKWDKIQTKEAEKYAAKIKKYTEQRRELEAAHKQRLERLEIESKEIKTAKTGLFLIFLDGFQLFKYFNITKNGNYL